MSASVLQARRQVRGLGLPETEWDLLQPHIDSANDAAFEAQELAARALAEGGISQEEYSGLLDGDAREFSALAMDASVAEIETRADAAPHLRSDPELLADVTAWAAAVRADVDRLRTELFGSSVGHASRMALSTIAAGATAILLVAGLAAWTFGGKKG